VLGGDVQVGVVVFDASVLEEKLWPGTESDDVEHGTFADGPQKYLHRVAHLIDAGASHTARSIDKEDAFGVDFFVVLQFDLGIQRYHGSKIALLVFLYFATRSKIIIYC